MNLVGTISRLKTVQFKPLRLATKIQLCVGILIVITLAMIGIAYSTLSQINSTVNLLKNQDLKFQQNVTDASMGFVSDDDNTVFLVGLGVGSSRFGDQKLVDQTVKAYQDAEKQLLLALVQLRAVGLSPQESIDLQKAAKDFDAYLTNIHKAQDNNDKNHALAQQAVFVDDGQLYFTVYDDLNVLSKDAQTRVSNHTNLAMKYGMIESWMIGICALVVVVLGSLSVLIVRRATKPLRSVTETIGKMANGDFTMDRITIKTNDDIGELGNGVNLMSQSLKQLIAQVTDTSTQLAASSEELLASAEQTSKATEQVTLVTEEVSAGTETQVKNVQDSVKAINDMSLGIGQIAASSQTVSISALQTTELASEGNRAIQSAIEQMNSINETVTGLSSVVQGLGDRSQEIGQIVGAITSIASQTNLLALNAAIEAARAGEHGRGFAVVADEVRKLAEQSSASAGEISELISKIQAETTSAVQSMEAGTKEVEIGLNAVSAAGTSFEDILKSVKQVTSQIQEVSATSEQLSAGTVQVVESMDAISEVTDLTAAGTQNVSAAAEEQLASMEEITASANALTKMAEDLQTLVGRFRI
ncbi:MAG: hypothetical protein JWN30_2208 [Bacilli bacterium]|nr:hypothetical protein [Bacilli bacterium]